MSLLNQLNVGFTRTQAGGLSDTLFYQIRDFIYQKSGIYFPDNKKYLLESRLKQRINALKLSSYEEYFRKINNGLAREELNQLFDAITINETYFFRNEAQLNALRHLVIPELIPQALQSPQKSIRLWSAACSSGEEAYTLALIMKEEFLPRYPGLRAEVLGTDINTQVLQVAQEGVYREYAVRKVPPNYLRKYFRQTGMRYEISAEIKQMVRFARVNLFDQIAMQRIRNVDVIFCANVLIYFDEKSKRKVVSYLYDSLKPNGYLFLGYSESLHGISHAFKPVHFEKTIVYKKELRYA